MDYGFIGTGAITRAMVTGLSSGEPNPPTIAVSPRNITVSSSLAARFRNVEVCSSNSAVVDQAEVVVLAVRPQDAAEALPTLPFRAEQAVVSVIAGLAVEEVSDLVAPAKRVARAIPLPDVARRTGSIPVYPADETANAMFARLGRVINPRTEQAFNAYSAVSALVAGYLDYLDSISGWLTEQGASDRESRDYVGTIFREVTAHIDGTAAFAVLADEHATPGGLNEMVREITSESVRQIVRDALAAVQQRIDPPAT